MCTFFCCVVWVSSCAGACVQSCGRALFQAEVARRRAVASLQENSVSDQQVAYEQATICLGICYRLKASLAVPWRGGARRARSCCLPACLPVCLRTPRADPCPMCFTCAAWRERPRACSFPIDSLSQLVLNLTTCFCIPCLRRSLARCGAAPRLRTPSMCGCRRCSSPWGWR